jgi:hypothetical protein
MLAGQALYYLRHTSSPIYYIYRERERERERERDKERERQTEREKLQNI